MLIRLTDSNNNSNNVYGLLIGETLIRSQEEFDNTITSVIAANGGVLVANAMSGGFDATTIAQGPGLIVTTGAGALTIDATPAFDKANAAHAHANAAYGAANSISANVSSLVTDNVPETTTNLYFTSARVRANVSNTAPITYNSTTGVFGHALSGVNATTYGNSTFVSQVTIDSSGHITGASNVAIDQSVAQGAYAHANGAFAQANIARTNADAAFANANTAIYTAAQIRANIGNSYPVYYNAATGVVSFVPATANGQLLIGNTVSGTFDVNTITQGTGIVITNDKGSITIAATGGSALDQFARDQANAAYAQANIATTNADAAFAQANSAALRANTLVTDNVPETTTNLYFTAARVRANISNTAPITYNQTSGVIGHTLSGVTATTYGNATHVSQVTIDTTGHITGAANVLIDQSIAQGAYAHANGAFAQANIATTNADAAFLHANAAYANANTAIYTATQIRANISNTYPVYYNATTGVVSFAPASANGQLLIGNTVSGSFDVNTIAQTTPIIVTNGKGTVTLSHASSGVVATTYGNASHVSQVTIDQFGHTTAAVNTPIAISTSQVTSGVLSVARGGTGQTAITVNGSLLIANTVSGGYDVNTLTQGSGILITNDKGSITIAATGGGSIDQFARDTANGAYAHANGAFNKANIATTNADAAFAQANIARTNADAAFANANTAIYTAAQIRANISNAYPIYYNATTGVVSLVPSTANGQLLIGNTVSGTFDVNTLTQGSGILITNDKGSVTIAATGGAATDQFARDTANGAFTKANGAVQTGFTTLNVSGRSTQSNITPASNADTLKIVAGNNVIIRTNNTTKTLTYSVPVIKYPHSVANNIMDNWVIGSSPRNVIWQCVEWSAELGIFVATAISGTRNRVATSPDGIVWTLQSTPTDENYVGLAWSPDLRLFAAVNSTNTGNRIMTSANGVTWTARSTPSPSGDLSWTGLTWSPELQLFAAVAGTGTGTSGIMTSANGVTWTMQTNPINNNWQAVAWSPELRLFAAVGISGTGTRVMTSPDGVAWTTGTSAADLNWLAIAWSSELQMFAAVASSGTGNRVMTSYDGVLWTSRTSAADNDWASIVWAPELGMFVAIAGAGGTNSKCMTSIDGINWVLRTNVPNNVWSDLTWSPELGILVAVSQTGTDNRVMTTATTNVSCVDRNMRIHANNEIGRTLILSSGHALHAF